MVITLVMTYVIICRLEVVRVTVVKKREAVGVVAAVGEMGVCFLIA